MKLERVIAWLSALFWSLLLLSLFGLRSHVSHVLAAHAGPVEAEDLPLAATWVGMPLFGAEKLPLAGVSAWILFAAAPWAWVAYAHQESQPSRFVRISFLACVAYLAVFAGVSAFVGVSLTAFLLS